MNFKLINRRRRTLLLLAGCNSRPNIVAAVSDEFQVQPKARSTKT